jgi:two-component system heavy metal sensor histidine kinase CusS
MLLVLAVAVGGAALAATWLVGRLTRIHGAIAEVAQRVAGGDLTARVGVRSGDPELDRMAGDVDDMIERLSLLVASQQRFIGHAAHELRSPLTTLYGELQHALRRQRDAASYRATIEEALVATRRLKLLAEDLLALARLGASPPEPHEPVALLAIIREAIEDVRGLTTARNVTVDLSGEDAIIQGHRRDLLRLVRNLIENAANHAPEGGRLWVRVDARPDGVEVRVSDNGAGVKAADRERVFDPFYRGSAERASTVEGAGLGLAIASEIARLHGGSVRLGDEGPGATFVVHLPHAKA